MRISQTDGVASWAVLRDGVKGGGKQRENIGFR